MIKTSVFCVMAILATFSITLAQTNDCDQLRSEVEYLKKALKMQNEAIFTDSFEGVEVKILKVEGSKRTQTVEVEFLFTNKKANVQKRGTFVAAIDMEGNKYNSEFAMHDNLYTDVPTRYKSIITGITSDVARFKILKYGFGTPAFTGFQTYYELTYKDVLINWR